MAMSVTESNALNSFVRYLAGDAGVSGQPIPEEHAVDCLAVLLRGASKTLGAGYRPDQAQQLLKEIQFA